MQLETQVQNMARQLDELLSQNAIRDLSSDYCHGFDKRDEARFLSIWWEDCVWNIGPPFGSFSGHAGVRSALHDVLWPAWEESHHLCGNHVIRLQSPDQATSECDVDCVGTLAEDGSCQMVGATYRDHLTRREGVWRISQRDVEIHYFSPVPHMRLGKPE